MTVRDRAFHRYHGPRTARRTRFLVLWRYARRDAFSTRRATAVFALGFAPLLAAAVLIYLRYNLPALEAMELEVANLVAIDGRFFNVLMRSQTFVAFLFIALVGPGLVSPDLANNGLPLYLCRPFSRAEYVLGKLSVLVIFASLLTWVPLLLLVMLQASLDPGWLADHAHVPPAIFAGSAVAILFLSLLALALSAWIKWRILAGAMMFAFVVVASGVAENVNILFRTEWGDLLSPGKLLLSVWEGMLLGADAVLVRIPLGAAWAGLAGFCLLCLLVLHLKLRAYEVVR